MVDCNAVLAFISLVYMYVYNITFHVIPQKPNILPKSCVARIPVLGFPNFLYLPFQTDISMSVTWNLITKLTKLQKVYKYSLSVQESEYLGKVQTWKCDRFHAKPHHFKYDNRGKQMNPTYYDTVVVKRSMRRLLNNFRTRFDSLNLFGFYGAHALIIWIH